MTPSGPQVGITGVQFWSCRSRTAASGSPNAAAFWYQLIASDLFGCKPTAPSLRRKFGSNVFPTPVPPVNFPLGLRVRTQSRRTNVVQRQHRITPLDQHAHRIRRGRRRSARTAAGEYFAPPHGGPATEKRRGCPAATVSSVRPGQPRLPAPVFHFSRGLPEPGRVGMSRAPCARYRNRCRTFLRRSELTGCGLSSGRSLSSAPPRPATVSTSSEPVPG